MGKIYTQASYHKMIPGEKLIDNFLGSIWVVEERIAGGARLRNDRDNGVHLDVTPESTAMYFRSVAA